MSQILFLGTGAADWNPKAASADPAYRRLTAAMVNDGLLIDCGPCVFEFAETFHREGLYRGVTDLLVTHSHNDHFNPENIALLAAKSENGITVHGFGSIEKFLFLSEKLRFSPVVPYETFSFGRYTVTPLPANHSTPDPGEQPLHYIVTDKTEDKTFFWGCDGAWLLNGAYHVIRKMKFDAMIFDCTVGDLENDFRMFEHNNIRMVEEMVKSLVGCHHVLKDAGQLYVNHMARTLHTDHETLVRRLSMSHIIPAHDGMTVTL